LKPTHNIQEIIAGCLQSNRVHQRALVDGYSGLLYVICNRYLGDKHSAQDALQESWSLIFTNLHTYEADKGKFESWASTITIRHCLNLLARKRLKFVELAENAFKGKEQELREHTISNLDADQLLSMVAKLPGKYRTVFNMAVIDGYAHKEIAAALNITIMNSRARLARAKNLLKERITSQNNSESWVYAI